MKTACLKSRSRLMQTMVRALVALGIAPNLSFLSQEDLITLLTEAGFEIEQTTYFDASRMSPFIVARRPAN